MEKFSDELEKFISSQFTDEDIAKFARKFDVDIKNGKAFIGVESLAEYLDENVRKAAVVMATAKPNTADYRTGREVVENFMIIRVVILRATEYVRSVLSAKAKEVAERN